MSLSFALNTAATGLRATSRAADLVSSNVANALTPGYARRELVLEADIVGTFGGVRVVGVDRITNPLIIADRREAEANAGGAQARAGALLDVETAIGDPTAPGSLSDRVARFTASLVEAASRPESDLRLKQTVSDAKRLAAGFNEIGREIQSMRTRADTQIGVLVDRVNTAVRQVDDLNEQILRLGRQERESTLLQEQRQQVIDGIATILPVREVLRPNGEVALYTVGGAVLLDGVRRELAFSPRGAVEPWMTQAGGALSGLTLGGDPIDTTGARALLGEGAMKAQFDLRDVAGPEAQAALDALARDLIERFQDPGLDPTLPAGPPLAPGLFTDGGGAFDGTVPFAEEGLAQRIAVNTEVDPEAGGAAWRLRDGLGAAAPGPTGDAQLLNALADRMGLARAPASGPYAGQARPHAEQVGLFLSGIASTRQAFDTEAAFQSARLEGLREQEAFGAVDTDDEMQKLLVIEQAYGANARVVQTIDRLIDQLLRI